MGFFKDIINHTTDALAGIVNNHTNQKFDAKEQENLLNAQIAAAGGSQMVGSLGKQQVFGSNMKDGITSTFGDFAAMFGSKRGGNLGNQPGGNGNLLMIGGVAILVLWLFTGKKKRR